MGLDCFWEMPDGKEHPEFNPPLELCGGMFSGHGSESFRGKVYARFVEEVSGESLYEDLTNKQVKKIADALESDEAIKRMDYLWEEDQNSKVLKDLRRMFRKYANAGATLKTWF
jgi:hypothetical protein